MPGTQSRPLVPGKIPDVLPGLLLCIAIAAAGFLTARLPVLSPLSPLILAVVIGIAVGNLPPRLGWVRPGADFAVRVVLRAGIVLLGLQLTVGQVASVGLSGLAIVVVALVTCFFVTRRVGRALAVPAGLTDLIAAGTSVCGASAVIAANTVVRAPEEDAAYAVATVTVFGTLAMMLLPIAGAASGMSADAYGLWVGASVHEVAQVTAAAFQRGTEAGEVGTIAKLVRVLMLAPVVLTLGALAARRGRGAGTGVPIPWFVVGFVVMVAIASTGAVPGPILAASRMSVPILLAVALAGMGLKTDMGDLMRRGLRPALLAALSWLLICGLTLAMVLLVS